MNDKTPKYHPDQGLPMSLVVLLAVLAGVSVANIYYCQPLLNLIRNDLSMSEFWVNLMPVMAQVGYATGLLLIIPAGDLFNRRTTILACFTMLVASLTVCALSFNAAMLLSASLVVGVCSVAPQIFMPFVSRFSKPDLKARMVGYVLAGLLMGILLSRFVSGWIGLWMGWRAMYVIAAALAAVGACVAWMRFPYVTPSYQGTYGGLLRSVFSLMHEYPQCVRYSLRAALCFASFFGLWACLTFRMGQAPFYEGSDTVGMLALLGGVGVLSAMKAGKMIHRYGTERFHTIGVIMIATAWIEMLFLDDTYFGIIFGIVAIDIGLQFVQLANQTATMSLCSEASSRLNTIFMTSNFTGAFVGTFLAGTLWSFFGWQGTVASGLILLAVSVCITVFWKLPDPKNQKR